MSYLAFWLKIIPPCLLTEIANEPISYLSQSHACCEIAYSDSVISLMNLYNYSFIITSMGKTCKNQVSSEIIVMVKYSFKFKLRIDFSNLYLQIKMILTTATTTTTATTNNTTYHSFLICP